MWGGGWDSFSIRHQSMGLFDSPLAIVWVGGYLVGKKHPKG